MTRKNVVAVVSFSLLLAGIFGALVVQAGGKDRKGSGHKQEEQQEMMAVWQKLRTPGQYHKHLRRFEGSWKAKTKVWMQPGDEPIESSGTVENKMILGGRYLYSEYHSTFMGEPMEAVNINAYDKYRKEFISIWIDNMATGVYETRGKCDDPECRTITMTGVWDDPMTGGTSKVRSVSTIQSDTKQKFEMFMTGPDGKEFRSLVIHYRRK